MKSCPQCGTQYPDDTLQFCLQDGARLRGPLMADTPTVVLNETETVVARGGERFSVPIGGSQDTGWQNTEATRVATAMPPKKGSNAVLLAAAVVVVLLLALGGLGLGGLWLYTRRPETGPNGTTNVNIATNVYANLPVITNATPKANTSPTVAKTPAANANTLPPPPPDDSQVRGEVTQKLGEWKSSLESRDVNGYMGNYADTVDYYKKGSVNVGSVRADKMRAFQAYGSMQVNVSNVDVAHGANGDTATVTFDKEWHFSGRSQSSGKVRAQFNYRKINGRWLITGERDLKLYYKN